MFDSRDVAAFIAQTCVSKGYTYNNTKIQKLLYCAYGASLAVLQERLCDEYPRAWEYGPVFPKVFKAISKGNDLAQYSYEVRDNAPQEVKDLIDKVVSGFGQYTGTALSRWSHRPGSPWQQVVEGFGKLYDFIPDDIISAYFKEHVMEPDDYAAAR